MRPSSKQRNIKNKKRVNVEWACEMGLVFHEIISNKKVGFGIVWKPVRLSRIAALAKEHHGCACFLLLLLFLLRLGH